MRTLKAIIAVLTLVAVAAQPVAASLIPCCCTKPGKCAEAERREPPQPTERSCCRAAEHLAKPATTVAPTASACCTQKHSPTDSVLRSGCCCLKALPAVPASSDQMKQLIEQPSVQPAHSSVDCLVHAPAIRRFEQVPGNHALTGPPLLALYCIWLK